MEKHLVAHLNPTVEVGVDDMIERTGLEGNTERKICHPELMLLVTGEQRGNSCHLVGMEVIEQDSEEISKMRGHRETEMAPLELILQVIGVRTGHECQAHPEAL